VAFRPPTKNLRETIPEPIATVESLHATVMALREAVQTLNGQRDPMLGAVTFTDIVLKGWIEASEVPRDGGFVKHVPLVSSSYTGPNS
jgi:hypothetical protein